MNVAELFTGCGGLAYGLCEAGLRPVKMVEANSHAFCTVEENRAAAIRHVRDWPVSLADVCNINWHPFRGVAQIVAGGPPCQPFSQAGLAGGQSDNRNMWPQAIRAVEEIEPEAFLFENVRGLMRSAFQEYFNSILDGLRDASQAGYVVLHTMVDAADFGAAQRRHRVIVAGFRKDLVSSVGLPFPSHSKARLLWDQWVEGSYWIEHGLRQPSDEYIIRTDLQKIRQLRSKGIPPPGLRWRTVRDAINGLGEPDNNNCHVLRLGARSYKGHTGSVLDQPAKALKAGMHGVPGGENMLRLPDGSVRYFTVREMARLQGFPDEFIFPGNWTESTRQLGNAVPVALGRTFAKWVVGVLETAKIDITAGA